MHADKHTVPNWHKYDLIIIYIYNYMTFYYRQYPQPWLAQIWIVATPHRIRQLLAITHKYTDNTTWEIITKNNPYKAIT